MPRFRFHFVTAGTWVDDDDGKELPSLADAHCHAVRLVEQATSHFDDAHDWRGWTVRICGPEDQLLLTVLFPFRSQRAVNQRQLA